MTEREREWTVLKLNALIRAGGSESETGEALLAGSLGNNIISLAKRPSEIAPESSQA